MPTYVELQTESYWAREFEPPNLAKLNTDLRAHFGVGRDRIGSKGDNNHLRGYHRSREWILRSRFSLYKAADYSVQHALDKVGDARWLAAIDFQTAGGVAELIQVCKRLDAAVRAGRVPQLREWYGNIDGDKVVDGWDAVTKRAATSDSSHLWHLHMSFFRGRVNDDHTTLYEVLIGDDMPTAREVAVELLTTTLGRSTTTVGVALQETYGRTAAIPTLTAEVAALRAAVESISGGNADVAAILAGVDERLAAYKAEIAAVVDTELDEQSRAGADVDG